MARETIVADLQTAITGGVPDSPLLLPIMDGPAASHAHADYDSYSTNAQTISEVWNTAISHFDLDWAGLFIDDLFEYEPLGIEVIAPSDLPRAVAKHLPVDRTTLNALRIPDPRRDGRMPVHLEAQARIRDRWGQSVLISGSVAAPFSGLTLMFGIEQTMLLPYDDPELLRQSINFTEELAITWGRALIDGGADLIWLGDCSASGRFIPIDFYKEYALEPASRVASALKRAGGAIIYHAGENNPAYLQAMCGVDADILSVESGVDIGKVKDAVGDRICLMGNLDSLNLIWHGSPAEIRSHINGVLGKMTGRGGYIPNVGESIPTQTPVENIEAMIVGIREAWERHFGKP